MKIIALGELLWDCLPAGREIGGAAANFVYHATQAGADARLMSAVGRDKAGDALVRELASRGVPHYIQRSARYPTGTVEVTLDKRGAPQYDILGPVAWDDIQPDVTLFSHVRAADALYFGSLVQRYGPNQRLLRQLVGLLPPQAKILVDINLRAGHYQPPTLGFCLRHADILKLNDEELPLIAAMFGLPRDPQDFYQHLRRHEHLDMMIYTRGERGSRLFRGNDSHRHPGLKVTPVDTVGAGDAFTAVACVMALRNEPLADINRAANQVAAYICTRAGAMPALPAHTGG
ncbi:carbohydrate kinase family protein [Acerihabitans arboris]|uniref:Carbohydrate kinase n=1 Tax=Acerihabitans arboris TaxID=2691583 RepID=A0A845SEH9_9GAMM|nr:carbohydrate kinase [Acerihabitans arboris]NDL61777.1 carbohydrate kinase [Acerihabitans arboris]